MTTITKVSLFGALTVASLTGCAVRRNTPPELLDPTPIPVDAAMERRQWDESKALYANTTVIAGNTGFPFVEDQTRPDWQNGLIDPFTFFGNVVSMPVSLIIVPPWKPVEYRAVTVEPTYNGNPPLPPSEQNDLTAPTAPESEQPTQPPPPPPQPMEQPPAPPAGG
jgi:hypothetical protein